MLMPGSMQFVFESPLKNAPGVCVVVVGVLVEVVVGAVVAVVVGVLTEGVSGAKLIVEGADEA